MGDVKSQQKSAHRRKIMTSFVIFYCTFVLGVVNNMLGPVIIDFSNKFETNVDSISLVFTILLTSSLIGAFSYGFFSKFVPRLFLVLIFLSAMTMTQFIIPFVSSMTIFFILSAFTGTGSGGYDCSQIAWIIDIWRGDASVYILTQHFTYSLGAAVPAFLLAPFLNGEKNDNFTATTTTTVATTSIPQLSLDSNSTVFPPKPFKSQLEIPFVVAGILGVVGIVLQLIFGLGFQLKSKPEPKFKSEIQQNQVSLVDDEERQNDKDNEGENEDAKETTPTTDENTGNTPVPSPPHETNTRGYTILLTVLSCCILGVYAGMEMTNLQFIPTFAVYSEVNLTEKEAARVLSGLTIAFSAMRFVGIFVVMRVKPHFIIFGNFALIIAGNLILFFGGISSETLLWVGCIFMGAGMSTVYPAYYAYIEKHLHVTDRVAAIVSVSGGLMGAIYPLIIGNLIKETPSVLLYVNFFSILVFMLSFVTVFWLTAIRGRRNASHS